jgi:uncharacterized protein YqeY
VSLKQQIDDDLKQAMLAGDKTLVTTLRGLKASILNLEVANGSREQGLTDDEVIAVLTKQAKQRQESADLYVQGGSQDKADAELAEKAVIEKYLPAQISEEELSAAIDKVIADTGAAGMQAMGQVIGAVKQQFGASADGSTVARLVKEKLGA